MLFVFILKIIKIIQESGGFVNLITKLKNNCKSGSFKFYISRLCWKFINLNYLSIDLKNVINTKYFRCSNALKSISLHQQ